MLPGVGSKRQMKGLSCKGAAVYAVCIALLVTTAAEALPKGLFSLRETTLQAFGKYVVKTEAQNDATLRQGPFLWVDSLPAKDRTLAMAKLRSGEVQLRRLSVHTAGENPEVPGGMIHDWEGIIFIPGASIDQVLKVLQDYDHHATYYSPDVVNARLLSRDGDQFRAFLRFRRQKFVTVVLD